MFQDSEWSDFRSPLYLNGVGAKAANRQTVNRQKDRRTDRQNSCAEDKFVNLILGILWLAS